MGDELLITKNSNTTYNIKLFYMLIYNFNKYQNMKEGEGKGVDKDLAAKELADKDYIINFLEDELNGIFDKWEDCKKKLLIAKNLIKTLQSKNKGSKKKNQSKKKKKK